MSEKTSQFRGVWKPFKWSVEAAQMGCESRSKISGWSVEAVQILGCGVWKPFKSKKRHFGSKMVECGSRSNTGMWSVEAVQIPGWSVEAVQMECGSRSNTNLVPVDPYGIKVSGRPGFSFLLFRILFYP